MGFILSKTEEFSTDTASLTYASSSQYTLATLNTAPVGTFITFTYAASTNTRTQTTTAPTQTTADMNVNGIQIYTRAYNAASTAGNPAAVAIQIGKGLKGVSLNLYKSTAKATAGTLDAWQNDSASRYGAGIKDYNELTGILVIDAGFNYATTTTAANFSFSDITQQTSGYVTINASKSPALVGVPLLQPRIATISDVKATATAGGTFTSGAWQTRTLNTLVDGTGIVTSLASNQFTLPAGTYYVDAQAPAYIVNFHKAKLRNITDSTDVLLGTSSSSDGSASAGNGQTTLSIIQGEIVLSSPKVFEIQHQCTLTRATDGFGAVAGFSVSETYTTVKITKVK